MEKSGHWKNLLRNRLFEFFGAAMVIITALGVTWAPVLSGNPNLAGRFDVYRTVGPVSYYMDWCIHHGEIPYWNPLTFCGMPFAANPVTTFFYPLNLLRSVLTFDPTPYKAQFGWIVLMGFHLVLAGMGMYYLARRHGLSRAAGLLAAFVFIFSAIWVRRVAEYHFIIMTGWVPLLLLLFQAAMKSTDWRIKFALGLFSGLLTGVALLSGAMNIAMYFGLILCGYYVLYRLFHLPSRRVSVLLMMGASDCAFLILVFSIGGLLAMPLLLSGAELSSFSARSLESGYELATPRYTGSWLQLFHSLIRYPGTEWKPEDIRGAGVLALVLALLGLTHRRFRECLPHIGIFAVLFDCAMGRPWPVATLVDLLSPIQLVSSTRAFDFALIPLGMIAGFGLDAAISGRRRGWWRVLVHSFLVGAGAGLLYFLHPLLPAPFVPVTILAIIPPAVGLVLLFMGPFLPGRNVWRSGVVLCMFLETFVWSANYIPYLVFRPGFQAWAGVYPGAETLWPSNQRGSDPTPNRHLYTLSGVVNGYEPAHIARVRAVTASDARGRVYHRLVTDQEVMQDNQRGNLLLKRAFWLARQYVKGPLPPKDALFPATTTVFLREPPALSVPEIDRAQLPARGTSTSVQVEPVLNPANGQPYHLVKRPGQKKQTFYLAPVKHPGKHGTLRLTYTSGTRGTIVLRFHDPTSGRWEWGRKVNLVVNPGHQQSVEVPLPDYSQIKINFAVDVVNPMQPVTVERLEFVVDEEDEDALLHILARTANSIEVELRDLPGYRVLTYLDAAYPGWTAAVDGNPVPILLADDAFKAVEVPPGTHRVRFEYTPKPLIRGLWISGATLVLALVLLMVLLLCRPGSQHRSPNELPPPSEPAEGAPPEGSSQAPI